MIEIGYTRQNKIYIFVFAINDKLNCCKYFISKFLSLLAIVYETGYDIEIIWRFYIGLMTVQKCRVTQK